jgi:hypothetical protein
MFARHAQIRRSHYNTQQRPILERRTSEVPESSDVGSVSYRRNLFLQDVKQTTWAAHVACDAKGPDIMTALIEADLFQTISELLAEQNAISGDERRGGKRRSYNCIQLLAPYDANQLPQQEDFRQVQCRDLSPRGFSFLAHRQPATDHVVVALGAVPFKFFVAKIIHSGPSENELSQDYLVGCRFVRRLAEQGS